MFSGRTANPLFLAAEGAFSPPLFLFLAPFLAVTEVGAAGGGAGSDVMPAIGIGCWVESSSMTFGGGSVDVVEDNSSDASETFFKFCSSFKAFLALDTLGDLF